MAKITVEGQVYEGTPEELREIFEMMGVKFPIEPAEVEEIKVGDYVKVGLEPRPDVESGDIGVVIENDGSNVPYRFKRLNDGFITWFKNNGQLVRATEEEVAEAKAELERKQAEKALEEKWAKICRKPNEFKEGDIVKVTGESSGKTWFGTIEGKNKMFGGFYFREFGDNADDKSTEKGSDITLIAPVESRFDEAK